MVTVNRNGSGGHRSRIDSPSHANGTYNSDSDPEPEGQMRVGSDYQAVLPVYNPDVKPEARAEAMLVWAPPHELKDSQVDQYVKHAKDKHNYNIEQALGMLFWHKHDIEKALTDLANFTPFPDEWTVEDKVLFEQAFSFHGKSFHRIRQMLPDKSIAALVKYYYSWKKTRTRTSLMDRQARRFNTQEDNDSADSEASGDNDSDIANPTRENGKTEKETCSNCGIGSSQQHPTPRGSLCSTCYQYWRRTGLMRPNVGPRKESHHHGHSRHNPIKNRHKPPRGMYMNAEDVQMMANSLPGQGDAILKNLDAELVQLKRQVQNNKQMLGVQKHKTNTHGIQMYKVPESSTKINPRWTNEELLLAVQGVRRYGKNFAAIAETIGNKTEMHIRSFFVNYRRRYNLDECLSEFEMENGKQEEFDDAVDMTDMEKMDSDKSNNSSNNGSGVPSPVTVTDIKAAVDNKAGPPPLLKQPTGSPQKMSMQSTRIMASMHRPQPPPLIKPNMSAAEKPPVTTN